MALIRVLFTIVMMILTWTGLALAWKAGGFWWILFHFVPPVAAVHGFAHFAHIWGWM